MARKLTTEQCLADDLMDASRNDDVTTFEECVGKGADVLCKNKAQWNILHYIGLYRSYRLLCHVIKNYVIVLNHINDVTDDGTTPLHMACTPNPPDIRIIEKFVRLGGDLLQRDLSGKGCQDKTFDRNTKNFLQWRKLHPSGLPDSVLENQKTADNDIIMKYLRTFAFMDDGFARRYELALKGREEKSSNIRVIFLGPQGVGKTTMTYNLLELPLPEGGVDSTNTMDVDLNRLMINLKTGERIYLRGNDMERSTSLHRLRDMLGTLSLSEKTPKQEEKSTEGKRSYSGEMAYVNIFDFGGEIMFSNFQHIFLNADAVIILTFSLHNCLNDKAILETVYFWLKFIHTYSIEQFRPPVILAGTHLDEIDESKRTETLETIMATLKPNSDIAHIFEQHVVDVIYISNLEPGDQVFEKLWKIILKCAPYQAQWHQLLPGHWIALEHDLMTLKSQGVKVMTFREIKERAETMDVTDVGAFLRYLHSARNILTFPTDSNQDLPANLKVILDPEWMIKAFRLIVTELKYHIRNLGQNDPLLQEYQRTRRLTRAFIDKVWDKEDTENFSKNSSTLLYYIERSELIVKPLPKEGETDDHVDMYIVPSMLQVHGNTKLVRSYVNQREMKMSSTFCISFKNKFIPDAVYDKFLASLLYRFEVISPKEDEPLLQRDLACFILTGNTSMVVHCKDCMIKVTLCVEKQFKFTENQGVPIRTLLEKLLTSTLQRNDQGHMEYTTHLEKDFEISRTDSSEVVATKAEKRFWFGDYEGTRSARAENVPSSVPSETLSLKQLSRIARNINANLYHMFFIELGMDDTTITQIRRTNDKLDFRSQVTRMLISWQNDPKTGEEATLKSIVNAMEANSMDSTDLLSEIKPLSIYEELKKVAEVTNQTKVPRRCLLASDVKGVARLIGKMFVVFFIELDLSNEEIEDAELNYNHDVEGMRENLLTKWLSEQGKEAHLVKIVMACQECRHLNWKKLVDVLKKTPTNRP